MFEKINVVEALVVTFAGMALIASVIVGNNDAVLALGGGLVGYLGAVVPSVRSSNG